MSIESGSFRRVLLFALFAGLHGCGGAKAEWEDCLGSARGSLDGYRKLSVVATEKIRALPPPGTDPTAVANRKVLDDALAVVDESLKSSEAAVTVTTKTVEAALAGADSAAADAAVQTGCVNLTAAIRQVNSKLAAAGPALQLYNQMTAK